MKSVFQSNPWRRIAPLVIVVWGLSSLSLRAIVSDDQPSALFLAQKIAESSGGTIEQYMAYARKLARTLSQFSAAKQQEILGIVIGDGNNGHGNDPGKVDPSNPGKGKGKGKS